MIPLSAPNTLPENVAYGAVTDSLFQPLPETGSLVFRYPGRLMPYTCILLQNMALH